MGRASVKEDKTIYQTIREDLELPDECVVIPFSAEKGTGRDELVRLILQAVGE